jgi:hypothetical protein
MALAFGTNISARDCHALPFGEESGGCETMAYCVCLSLALILVVKFLGGGGTSSGLWEALVLETTLTSGGQVNTHTHTHRRHFRHRHRPGLSALRAHIYPCTKKKSCIACHFKGCWRAGQCGGGGGGGCGGIQRSLPGTIVDIVPIAR